MPRQYTTSLLFIATCYLVFSLPLTALAQTCYDIEGWDIPYDITYSDNEQLLVTGSTDGGLLFLRIGLSGETLDGRAIAGWTRGFSILEADSNSYLITGLNYILGEPGDYLPFLLKVNAMGDELWQRMFLPTREDFPYPIARHMVRNKEAEAIYLATTDTVWMIGYDGTTLAARSAEEIGLPFFFSMDMTKTENGFAVLIFDNTILHFDEGLDYLGTSPMSLDIRTIYAFCAAPGGGFLLAGQGHDLHWKIIKVDNQGNTQWERTYNLPNYSWGYPKDIEVHENGFLLAGRLIKVDPPHSCAVLLKVDTEGTPQWLKEITDCDSDFRVEAFALPSNSNSAYAVGKASCTPSNSNQDVMLFSLDTIPSLILAEESAIGEPGFRLFPNPTTGMAQILLPPKLPATIWKISLFDLSGRPVIQRRERSPAFPLDTSNLLPGLYLLRITDGKRIFSQRLMVEK